MKVFCFTLPHICPQCKIPLDTHPSGTAGGRRGGAVGAIGSSASTTSGSGIHKRHKNKKRTSISNNAEVPPTTTKEQLQIPLPSNNGNVNNDNNRDDNDEPDDQDNGSSEDNPDDDDVDDDEGDNSNDDFVCHIMASRLLPFRLPYPFVRANQYPCAIVLRPTTGDFLK